MASHHRGAGRRVPGSLSYGPFVAEPSGREIRMLESQCLSGESSVAGSDGPFLMDGQQTFLVKPTSLSSSREDISSEAPER